MVRRFPRQQVRKLKPLKLPVSRVKLHHRRAAAHLNDSPASAMSLPAKLR
jgi:hypothetical protein